MGLKDREIGGGGVRIDGKEKKKKKKKGGEEKWKIGREKKK